MSGTVIVLGTVLASMTAGAAFSLVFADPTGVLFFLSFGGVGAYLVVRRPANSIGWLLILTAWGLAIGSVRVFATPAALAGGDLDTASALAAWFNAWGWAVAFIGFLGLTLVFPTGHLPGGRARWPSRIALGVEVVLAVAMVTAPVISVTPVGSMGAVDVPNPFAIVPGAALWGVVPAPTTLFVTMFVVFILGVVGLLIRWRRSVGFARLQYRWLVAALVLVAAANSIWAVATLGLSMDASGPAFLLVVLAYPCVPLAIGIAVVRYRLYDIDRLISRTIGWALVTGLLVTVLAIGVVGLQAFLGDVTQGETLAVAASTLVAFALFQPVRRRVQRAVDRRFDRARYDGERTAAAFADRLRHEVDLETLATELEQTAVHAVRPTISSLWLREHA